MDSSYVCSDLGNNRTTTVEPIGAKTDDEIGDCSDCKNKEQITGSYDIIQNEDQKQKDRDKG